MLKLARSLVRCRLPDSSVLATSRREMVDKDRYPVMEVTATVRLTSNFMLFNDGLPLAFHLC